MKIEKFFSSLTKPVSRIELIIAGILVAPLILASAVSAATTISTNISTGGTLSVTGTSTLLGNVGVGTTTTERALTVIGSASAPYYPIRISDHYGSAIDVLISDEGPAGYDQGSPVGSIAFAPNSLPYVKYASDFWGQLANYDGEGNLDVPGKINGVKVYRALLTQTGTNAPVATVLENSLGGTVVWTRTGAGVYIGTLNNAFSTGKTFLLLNNHGVVDGYQFQLNLFSTDVVKVLSSYEGLDDNLLEDVPIEILVYP